MDGRHGVRAVQRREFLSLSGKAAAVALGVAFVGRQALSSCVGQNQGCSAPSNLPCNHTYSPIPYAIGSSESQVQVQCGEVNAYTDCTLALWKWMAYTVTSVTSC